MPVIPIRTDFPRKVREIENTWIEMPDGVKLAARIWLPEDAEANPVPAVLEYLPYRKRDGTVERDHLTHPYFAGFGYAGVRVDMRGTGDSEGVCKGEYLKQEQDDGIAIIEWLARQPWCAGTVGMIGISWGGFNGLQIAARKPAALKAVITLCSTDDRYADDIHFMGGACLTDKLAWGATAFAIAHTPPDPAIVGDRWRDMWLERLKGNGLWMLDWFRHQRRDDFYRHGSICENYADVDIPVYAVGGWVDGYTNPIFRMMERLSGSRKALIGPWAHKYPHFAEPGPRIGFLQECLRWWDQHLKGIETGIMDEPMIRAWIQDPVRPAPYHGDRPGRWVAETAWKTGAGPVRSFTLAPGRLESDGAAGAAITVASPQTAGRYTQSWCSYGAGPDQALDQSREEGEMTMFLSDPLQEDVEILGFPMVEADVASNQPVANLIAVLSSSDPDGTSTLVSFGVLNLTHRKSHSKPEPMVPGKSERVALQLNVVGQKFKKGQRIRLALSTSLWPMVFPAPEPVALTLSAGAKLTLPLRPARPEDADLPAFLPAEGAAPLEVEQLSAGASERSVKEDLVTGMETYRRFGDTGSVRHLHTGMTVRYLDEDRFEIHPDDPNSARGTCTWKKSYARGDWLAEVDTTVTVQALAKVWRISAEVVARDGGAEIFRRDWNEDVARDLV
ncbi:MAG: CocE/NonD family hydrolase [Albidovulum sp.]